MKIMTPVALACMIGCASALAILREVAHHDQRGAELLQEGRVEDAPASFGLALEQDRDLP